MQKLRFPNILLAPPESVAESVKIPTPKTADDINDLFKEIDTEDTKLEKKAPKEKDEPEDKEIKDDKDKDDKDEDLDLIDTDEEIEKLNLKTDDDINPEVPPRKREILKKYPDVFKDFPFLEKMMYRDKEYTELFGSFDDAKELAERAEVFSQFENQLLAGDTKDILKNIKETDEKAFNIIVDDYLVSLAAVDKEAYFHVVGNLNRRLIMEMVEEANNYEKTDPDKAEMLKNAALLVNQFIFGNSKFTAPTYRVDKREDPKKDEVEQERLSFVKERFETARDDLQSQVDNTLRATISEYIDPKGNMSSYVKKNAVSDAMKYLGEAIASDPSVVKNLDRLWRDSFDNKFARETLNRIKSYYLSKAKGSLKSAIMKARAEALKDQRPEGRTKETDDREEEENPRRAPRTIPTGRPSQSKGKNSGPAKGESVTDFFMRD